MHACMHFMQAAVIVTLLDYIIIRLCMSKYFVYTGINFIDQYDMGGI